MSQHPENMDDVCEKPVLVADVIDRLFTRLSATYGAEWTRQWASVPITDVKTAWGHELAGYASSKAGRNVIKHALDNLPERCPNVIQFKNICRAAPTRDVPRLEAPKADKAKVADALAKIAPPSDNPHGAKAWAHRLKARHADGDRLSVFQISCYQTALGEVAA